MDTQSQSANALRGKSLAVKLRRGYKLKMGTDGRGRDNVVEGPMELTLDGQTVLNNLVKFEDRNGIREQLGLPIKAQQRSLRDKLAEVQMRKRAEEDTRFMMIAEGAARQVLQEQAHKTEAVPRPKARKTGKNRAIRGPARDR